MQMKTLDFAGRPLEVGQQVKLRAEGQYGYVHSVNHVHHNVWVLLLDGEDVVVPASTVEIQ